MTGTQVETPAEGTESSASSRKAWMIAGSALTGLVLLCSLVVVGVSLWNDSHPVETDSHTETYEQDVADVVIEVDVGGVNLSATEGAAFEVRRDKEWRGPEPVTEERWVDADSFEASAHCEDGLDFSIPGDRCEVTYSTVLPSGTDAKICAWVGDIDVDGLDGALRMESDTGDIEARNLRTTETVVEADVGEVVLEFAEVRGDITVVTDVGDVTILVPDDGSTYDVHFESELGDQDIDIETDVAGETDHVINVTTEIGDLEIAYA